MSRQETYLGQCFFIKENGYGELFQKAYEMGILPNVKFKIIHRDIFDSTYVISQGIDCYMLEKEELIELIK